MSLVLMALLQLASGLASGPPELPELPTVPEMPAPAEPEPVAPSPPTDDAAPGATPTVEPTTDSPQPAASEPVPPTPAVRCPCDELDWVCRQHNTATCSSAPSVTPSEPTERLEPARPERPEPTASDDVAPEPIPEARGLVLELGAGLGGCSQDLCEVNPISLLARGALGYRWPRAAIVANALVGGGPKNDRDPGGLLIVELDAGFELFVATTKRVDPHVGAGLGYMRVIETAVDVGPITGGTTDTEYYSRAAFRVGAGIPVRLRKGWSVGPRFDYTWGLLGKNCNGGRCTPTTELFNDAGSGPIARRRARQRFPRPWALTVEFRRQF